MIMIIYTQKTTTKQKHNLRGTSLSHIMLNFGLHVYTCTCDTKEPRTVLNRQQLCSAVTTQIYTYNHTYMYIGHARI